jgi:hypothetical protein
MQYKQKHFTLIMMTIMSISTILFVLPVANAAGSITVTPTSGAPSGTITVAGTGFTASQAVGIAIGTEITATETITTFSGTGVGPYLATLAHYPIKPGSFSMHWDTAGTTSDWTDNGDGTLASSSTYSAGGTVNYVTGVFGRTSTTDISTYALTAVVTYTYYQFKVTPTAGLTTTATGTFSTSVTLPSNVTNGNYEITAVDAKGGKGTTSLSIIPEGLSMGLVVVLSAVAIVAGTYFVKKPKTQILNHNKTI